MKTFVVFGIFVFFVLIILLLYENYYIIIQNTGICVRPQWSNEKVDIIDDKIVVVCAKYKRDVNFLNSIPYKHVIIEKDIDVPNIANEATSYLKYIIDNYNNLPNNIIFIHDENESYHHNGKFSDILPLIIQKHIYEDKNEYYELNNCSATLITHIGLNFVENITHFWEDIFQKQLGFGSINATLPLSRKCCAQFIVSKNRVLCRSKEFYEYFYNWIISKCTTQGRSCKWDPFSSYNMGRYCEWTWHAVFNGKTGKNVKINRLKNIFE